MTTLRSTRLCSRVSSYDRLRFSWKSEIEPPNKVVVCRPVSVLYMFVGENYGKRFALR
jgi:hypothetical protein